jgi:CyaY protein
MSSEQSSGQSSSQSPAQSESEFGAEVDAILLAIEESLDAHAQAADSDIEFETMAGILTIECEDGSKIIVNRQTPNREIWVAAKSGGFHFRKTNGAWMDTRGGPDLAARLTQCIQEQSGERVALRISAA